MSSDCPCCGDPRPPVEWRDLAVSLDDGASWAGRQLRVRGQPLAVLHHLARRAPHVVSRDALFMSALPEDVCEEQLGVVVYRLRQALSRAAVPAQVETVHAKGHRLIAA